MSSVMLAYQKTPLEKELRFPYLASYKLDGIRCHTVGEIKSRNDKLIPNVHIRNAMQELIGFGFDGELMVPSSDFNSVQSAIMSEQGSPNFTYNVFDLISEGTKSFEYRYRMYLDLVHKLDIPWLQAVEQVWITRFDELMEYMDSSLEKGYEGLILKSPSAPYKFGRSTLKQQYMLKYKYFFEDEGEIIDFIELQHNTDTSTKKKENLVPGNTLGAFVVLWKGKTFEVGTGIGMTAAFRKACWNNRDALRGQRITFQYQELSKYGIPRFPTYKVIRDPRV